MYVLTYYNCSYARINAYTYIYMCIYYEHMIWSLHVSTNTHTHKIDKLTRKCVCKMYACMYILTSQKQTHTHTLKRAPNELI